MLLPFDDRAGSFITSFTPPEHWSAFQ